MPTEEMTRSAAWTTSGKKTNASGYLIVRSAVGDRTLHHWLGRRGRPCVHRMVLLVLLVLL